MGRNALLKTERRSARAFVPMQQTELRALKCHAKRKGYKGYAKYLRTLAASDGVRIKP